MKSHNEFGWARAYVRDPECFECFKKAKWAIKGAEDEPMRTFCATHITKWLDPWGLNEIIPVFDMDTPETLKEGVGNA